MMTFFFGQSGSAGHLHELGFGVIVHCYFMMLVILLILTREISVAMAILLISYYQ